MGNDNSSLLGVIVDRSSFDDDDELTTCITTYGGRDAPSIIDENHPSSSSLSINLPDHHQQLHNQQQHLIDMNIPGGVGSISGMGGGAGGGGGVVMRNGKVRRKLRWKPRFGKKKSYNGDMSSNASVVSALTNRSNSTSRSSSTTRSFLSHFSKKSNTSFHTFHSTETPKATNKANRPQAPHTVMRPNYQDSFDHNNKNKNSKHSTIDTEGVNIQQQNQHQHQHHHQTIGLFRSNLDSVQESSPTAATNGVEQHDNENEYAEVVSRQNSPGIPRSSSHSVTDSKSISISTSTINNNNYEVKNVTDTSSISNASTTTHNAMQKPPMPSPSQKSQEQQQQQQQQSKPRRPPLFKRRMRHFKNSNNNNNSDNKTTQKACSSPTNTNETSSLLSISPSHSLEHENSVIPMSLGEEYEEDRRVLFDATKSPTASAATTANRNRSSSKKPRDIVTVTTTRSKTEIEKRDEEVSSVVTGSVSGGSASTQPEGVCLEEGIEESSASPSYHNPGDNQSIQSGSVNGDASSVVSHTSVLTVMQKRISLLTKKRSSSSASLSTASPQRGGSNMIHPPSPSGVSVPSSPFSSQQAADNPSLDSSSVTSKGLKKLSSSSSSGRRKEKTSASVPCDLDEGVFLEAERNLRAINEMAAEHMAHGEYEEAADVFEEILRGQQERYGHDHYRVGAALHNLGIVYLKKGDYTKAIEICQRAVAVRKESLVPNHPDVAVSLAQLGVAHLESQNFKKALSAFKDALHIRRNFLGARHHKCSKILNNIGCALYSIEDFVASKRAFDEALGIQRDALRSIPSTESTESTHMQSNALLLSMASTLYNIGSIKVRWGEFDEATVDIEEALLIQQSVLGDDHPTVLSTSDSIELIDSAQHGASNHRTNAHDFLMKKAVAVCSDTETNPTTMMTELFGIENLETISPKNWFLNACGPVSPRKTEKVGE